MAAPEYFNKRMLELGVYEDDNIFEVRQYDFENDEHTQKRIAIRIFEPADPDDIILNVWRLDRTLIINDHKDANPLKPNANNNRQQVFALRRPANPRKDKDGGLIKYEIPKGCGTYPFFPPALVEKYERKEKIKNLILTEGYFKAYKGSVAGFDVVGLSSITHFRDKQGRLHEDIVKLIKTCSPERVIILHDADCKNLSSDALKNGGDLFKRINSFYSAASNLQEALFDICSANDVSIFYGHIKPGIKIQYPTYPVRYKPFEETLQEPYEQKFEFQTLNYLNNPKGLDDLLCALPGQMEEVLTDFDTWNPLEGKYFVKINISNKAAKLRQFFNIRTVDDFYNHYQDIIGRRQFMYIGTTYEWNQEKGKIEMICPEDAKHYMRIGTSYYRLVQVPDKRGTLTTYLRTWSESTIKSDHGATILKHIPKYLAFCNVPSHKDYKPVLYNCYNVYSPFEHEPYEGDYTTSMQFIKHIFGEEKIEIDGKIIYSYELGLDYMQLLYQQPTHILPILALVSKERETGKTTFGDWLKAIFKANATFMSNADWENNFNSMYSTKLLIMTEEAMLEKRQFLEKIKALSTADKIVENKKNAEQNEIDFFGKLIFFSNNVVNFLPIDKEEKRFWVREIPSIPKEKQDPRFKENLFEEIPHFLYFLDNRTMVTENKNRQWFDYRLTYTQALANVQAHAIPKAEKLIRAGVKEMFLDFANDVIKLTANDCNELFLGNKYNQDIDYVRSILTQNIKVDLYANEQGKKVTTRYQYPVREFSDNQYKVVYKSKIGRTYVFKREDFVTAEEEAEFAMKGSIEEIVSDMNTQIIEEDFRTQPANDPF